MMSWCTLRAGRREPDHRTESSFFRSSSQRPTQAAHGIARHKVILDCSVKTLKSWHFSEIETDSQLENQA
jgi:hypothetical protein